MLSLWLALAKSCRTMVTTTRMVMVWLMVMVVGTIVVQPALGQATGDVFEANRRLGRGVNLGNFLEAPRGADWGVAIRDEHFPLIKEAGFDSIRLPVRWPDYAAAEAPFTIEPEFFAKVDRLLNQAEKADLNVVLNIHHYDGLDDAPAQHAERLAGLWKQIAARYANRPSSLVFELNNEPHDQLNDHWNAILVPALAAVRESNPTRPVIIGPPFWNGIWALSKLQLPDDPNLIVTVHMYNPHEFTHQGASWADDRVRSIRDLAWGTAAERKQLEDELEQAAEWGRQHKRPIYLGEFGAYSAAPMDSRLAWTTAVREAAEKCGMSWSYWEFAAGFGIYDPETATWREPLLRTLIPAK